MKTIPILGLIVAVTTFARIGCAQQQIFYGEPAAPGTPLSLLASSTTTFFNEGAEISVLPLAIGAGGDTSWSGYPIGTAYTAAPGDLVFLANPTGGDDPSNWLTVVRFFNPADPNGSQGLPATEDEAFFPANAGPDGFAAFQLFPNAVYLTTGVETIDGFVFGQYEAVGPVGSFTAGQVDYNTFQVLEPVPEPTSVSLLLIASVSLLARRRRPRPNTTGNQ